MNHSPLRSDILAKVPTFLTDIQQRSHNGGDDQQAASSPLDNSGVCSKTCTAPAVDSAMQQGGCCQLCCLSGQPAHVVTSHLLGDLGCPQLSPADRRHLLSLRQAGGSWGLSIHGQVLYLFCIALRTPLQGTVPRNFLLLVCFFSSNIFSWATVSYPKAFLRITLNSPRYCIRVHS